MLKRDPSYIASQLYDKGDSKYSKQKTIIEFPAWYEDKGLYTPGELTTLYGVFAIIIGDKYSVSRIPTFIKTAPIAVAEVEREGESYIQLIYGKDDPVIHSKNVIKHALSSYDFFESRFMRSKDNWFIEPDDIVYIMDNMRRYSGTGLGDNHIANELIVSFITRDPKDKLKYYRQNGTKGPYVYVDLMNVYYSRLSTVNKIGANYFSKSVVSALVQKSKKETKLERHLRT